MVNSNSDVQIYNTHIEQTEAAARLITRVAKESYNTRGRFDFVLSGGSTPALLYRLLAQPPFANEIPWNSTYVFWGDERLVPPDHDDSNYGQARSLLLDPLGVPPANILRIRGELSPIDAAEDYAVRLSSLSSVPGEAPRFDMVLLGLGIDGHTASLFPGAIDEEEEESIAMAVSIEYGDRPADRVTLTPRAFNGARHIIFLVSGPDKAEAVRRAVAGDYDPQRQPAHRIRPGSGSIHWILDKEAGALLHPG